MRRDSREASSAVVVLDLSRLTRSTAKETPDDAARSHYFRKLVVRIRTLTPPPSSDALNLRALLRLLAAGSLLSSRSSRPRRPIRCSWLRQQVLQTLPRASSRCSKTRRTGKRPSSLGNLPDLRISPPASLVSPSSANFRQNRRARHRSKIWEIESCICRLRIAGRPASSGARCTRANGGKTDSASSCRSCTCSSRIYTNPCLSMWQSSMIRARCTSCARRLGR
jgi:hypothetical protein